MCCLELRDHAVAAALVPGQARGDRFHHADVHTVKIEVEYSTRVPIVPIEMTRIFSPRVPLFIYKYPLIRSRIGCGKCRRRGIRNRAGDLGDMLLIKSIQRVLDIDRLAPVGRPPVDECLQAALHLHFQPDAP